MHNPESDYAANIELAEAPALLATRAAPGQDLEAVPAWRGQVRGRPAVGPAAGATIKSIVLAVDQPEGPAQVWLLLLRGDHELNEIKAGKLPGLAASASPPRRKSSTISAASPVTWARSRRPGRCTWWPTAQSPTWPISSVAPTARTTTTRAPTGAATCPNPSWSRTCATWSRATLARRQGRPVHPARHRGRPRVLPGHQVPEALKATFLDDNGKAGRAADGLLRDRRHPHRGRGHRAEPRRPRHHLAARHRPLRGGDLPGGLGQSETVQTPRWRCLSAKRAAWTSCSTTATAVRRHVRRMGADRRALRVTVGERGLNEGVVELQARREAEGAQGPGGSGLGADAGQTRLVIVPRAGASPPRQPQGSLSIVTDPKFSESVLDIRVYYEDTDAGGVVFYANYLKFLNGPAPNGCVAWREPVGLAERAPPVRCPLAGHVSTVKPARLDDLITIRSRITRIGRASIHFAQRAERMGNCLPRATSKSAASIRSVCVRPNCRTIFAQNRNSSRFRNKHASHQRHVVAFADLPRQRAGSVDHALLLLGILIMS